MLVIIIYIEKDICYNNLRLMKVIKMNISEYLSKFFYGTKDPSLKAMHYFMDMYNNFDKEMKFIHVAGTNGKGSCVEMLNNILIQAGYRVGKYISPYLIKYNEIISINNRDITDKEMEDLIKELDPKIKEYEEKYKVNLTLFELKTIIALLYFYRKDVDIVILETGLGGRYDCTNIIHKPIVSIITSIGYDHMNLLGNTLLEIALEKAGIIKEGSNTVCFSQEEDVNKVIVDTCKNKHNTLYMLNKKDIINYRYDSEYLYFDYQEYHDVAVNLKGKAQVRNALICLKTIDILKENGFVISIDAVKLGLSSVIHHGRMEVIHKNPLIIYDGAHNEPAIKNLQESINMYYKNIPHIYIISILKRKDHKKMLELLSSDKEATFIFTSGNDTDEYTDKDILAKEALNYIDSKNIISLDLFEALKYVKNKKDIVSFVIGSFYVYKDVVEAINKL